MSQWYLNRFTSTPNWAAEPCHKSPMPRFNRFLKQRRRFHKILHLPPTSSKLQKRRSNKAIKLLYASSDDISPAHVAYFMVETMYTLCTERGELRICPEKVSVGTHGDWNLGLFKSCPGIQPQPQSRSKFIEGLESETTHQWNLLVIQDLLRGYIQRSRLRLRRRRTSYKNLLWLICLVEMGLSIRWSNGSLEDCFKDLYWLKLEWSQVD